MKAVVYTEYGSPDVLHFKEVEKPTPKDDQVLVKVYAASINTRDWYLLTGKPFMVRLVTGALRKPKNTILGADVAGRVEAVGSSVKDFKAGDEVFADLAATNEGSLAEYVCATEKAFVLKPRHVSFENAAAVPMAGVTALQGLRNKAKIQAGQKVLINGASGGVGTFALQLAKYFGAEVTAVCSTRNLDMVRSLGADHVIDYTKEDFTKNGLRYDAIIAVNGYHPLLDYRRSLAPNGTHMVLGGTMAQIFEAMLLGSLVSLFGGKKIGNVAGSPNQQDLAFMAELLESGKITPVIDRCYPLSEAAEALRYLGEVHPRGKVVITVEEAANAAEAKRTT